METQSFDRKFGGLIKRENESESPFRWFSKPWMLGVVAVLTTLLMYMAFERRLALPLPFEDAAMLFRYAEIFAAGGGIAWNPGADPAASDGATDLLFVIALAPLIFLGIPSHSAAIALSLSALFALGFLFGRMNLVMWHLPPYTVLLLVVLLGSSPAWSFASSGFSPIIFGTMLSVAFYLTYTASSQIRPMSRTGWFLLGILCGLCGWWRPEGFLLSALVVALAWLLSRWKGPKPSTISVSDYAFFTVGAIGVFAAWVGLRLSYFGQLIPTSGVNKASQASEWILNNAASNFREAFQYYLITLAVILFVCLVCSLMLRSPSLILLPLTLITVASAIWIPFGLTLNWWGRMYWPLVPVLTAAIVTMIATKSTILDHVASWSITRRHATAALAIGGILIGAQVLLFRDQYGGYLRGEFHRVAYEALNPLDTSDVRVATTEAGLIPLAVDEGLALDTYVHNNRAIAEEGNAALPGQLESFAPNLIVVHGPTPVGFLGGEPCGLYSEQWDEQARILYEYAAKNGMSLIRSEQTGRCNTWNIFVSDSTPPHIRSALESLPDWGAVTLQPSG